MSVYLDESKRKANEITLSINLKDSDDVIASKLQGVPRIVLMCFFDGAEEMFLGSTCEPLRKIALRSMEFRDRRSEKALLMIEAERVGFGVELANFAEKQFALIHPNVNGTPRVTYYDHHGFYGHGDYNSIKECVDAFYTSGSKIVPSGTLDTISKSWHKASPMH